MKKIRFLPYGYTVRNGITVVNPEEAEIIRSIFENYINGDSLKDIAEMLTTAGIPYTEKTTVWDKARIARIIDNPKYLGTDEFAPIIEEDTFEDAATCKKIRQRYTPSDTSQALNTIRNRVKCGKCGSPMMRKLVGKKSTYQCWVCQNCDCGFRMKITDSVLLDTVNTLINRIIENQELLKPKESEQPHQDPPRIISMKQRINEELTHQNPNEDLILDITQDIINEWYKTSNAEKYIRYTVLRKYASTIRPQDTFRSDYFLDLIDYILLNEPNQVIIHTKTDAEIGERIEKDGD